MRTILRGIGFFALVAAGAFGATFLAAVITPRELPASFAWVCKASLVACAVVAITHFAVRRAGRSWSDYGVAPRRLLQPLAYGLLAGLLLGGAWAAAVYLLAPYRLRLDPGFAPSHFVAATLGTLAMGIAEETGYRTHGLVTLRERAGYWPAILTSSIIFIAAHVAGGVPLPAGLLVVGSASLLFGVVMLEARSLPLVVGLHAASNLVQDNVLRPGDGALFAISAAPGAGAPSPMSVWLALGVLNVLACAGMLVWARSSGHRMLGARLRGAAREEES